MLIRVLRLFRYSENGANIVLRPGDVRSISDRLCPGLEAGGWIEPVEPAGLVDTSTDAKPARKPHK